MEDNMITTTKAHTIPSISFPFCPSSSLNSDKTSSPCNSSVQIDHAVLSPCAACKILRRRCRPGNCILAPYFPPSDPLKFTISHRVFGASNIVKFLQEIPEFQRADAVSSMVYEASARIRDPVYGCTGAICQLQAQLSDLQAQLAKAQAQLLNMELQQANLVAFLCMETTKSHEHDTTFCTPLEPLWT